jgi:hypothetical protein
MMVKPVRTHARSVRSAAKKTRGSGIRQAYHVRFRRAGLASSLATNAKAGLQCGVRHRRSRSVPCLPDRSHDAGQHSSGRRLPDLQSAKVVLLDTLIQTLDKQLPRYDNCIRDPTTAQPDPSGSCLAAHCAPNRQSSFSSGRTAEAAPAP